MRATLRMSLAVVASIALVMPLASTNVAGQTTLVIDPPDAAGGRSRPIGDR